MKCKKCRYHYYFRNESWCDFIQDYVREDASCEHGELPEDYSEKQTNYDRIISKTTEELADWIADIADHGGGRCAPGCYDCSNNRCEDAWLDWLKQEATDGT